MKLKERNNRNRVFYSNTKEEENFYMPLSNFYKNKFTKNTYKRQNKK